MVSMVTFLAVLPTVTKNRYGSSRITDQSKKEHTYENTSNRFPSRLSPTTIKKLCNLLMEERMMPVSHLSRKAGMHHSRLIKYIEWFATIGAIQVLEEGRFKTVKVIEDNGKKILEALG